MCNAHFISCFANSCNLIKKFKTIFEYIRKKFRFVHTNTFCEYRKYYAHRLACILFIINMVLFSSFFFRKNYLLLSCATSVRLSVRPSVCPSVRLSVRPSVRLSSVEIISFRGNSLSNRPINLKIGLNVREGVVHVRKV